MPLPLRLVDGNHLLIDNSSLEVFTTCPRAAQYHFINKRRASEERSALKFGGIIHKALDARYRIAEPMYAQSPAVETAMVAIIEQEFSTWQPGEDDFRTHSFAVELINKYGQTYPFESFEIVKVGDKPFIEVPFAIPLGEIDSPTYGKIVVIWTGKIDIVYRHDGRIYVLDHKTTSMMGPSFFVDFELSHAMHGYCWAVEQLLNETVYGYVINALATRKPTKTGKALEFERKVYSLSRPHLEEWKNDTMHIVSDFVAMAERDYMPKHTKWCVAKYGTCPYHKVCVLPPEQREFMIGSGEYEDITWSPLNEN